MVSVGGHGMCGVGCCESCKMLFDEGFSVVAERAIVDVVSVVCRVQAKQQKVDEKGS